MVSVGRWGWLVLGGGEWMVSVGRWGWLMLGGGDG